MSFVTGIWTPGFAIFPVRISLAAMAAGRLTVRAIEESPSGWRKHPMLRYYRAAVFTEGRIDLGDNWLILDHDLGLMTKRKED